MSVNSSSRSSGGTTKTNYNSGGNTKSTNGTSKSSKASGSGATSKAKKSGGGFFSKLFGGGQSSFETRAASTTTKATKTTAAATKAKGKNGVAHITSYTKKGQRGQMASGTITVNGKTYKFNSGGAGKGNLPKGKYTVTRHMNTRTDKKTMMVGGFGYSFALNNKYDARVGATRTALRIHPDGGAAGTIGCIGIVGDRATQQRFRDDMNRELSRSGGRYSLTVD